MNKIKIKKQAVIFAGGKGLRLRPFTKVIPKPLLPVGDQSSLEILLKQLKRHNFNEIFLCVGYKADLIKSDRISQLIKVQNTTHSEDEKEPITINVSGSLDEFAIVCETLPYLDDTEKATIKGIVLENLYFATSTDETMIRIKKAVVKELLANPESLSDEDTLKVMLMLKTIRANSLMDSEVCEWVTKAGDKWRTKIGDALAALKKTHKQGGTDLNTLGRQINSRLFPGEVVKDSPLFNLMADDHGTLERLEYSNTTNLLTLAFNGV